jgi:hypothetical protein
MAPSKEDIRDNQRGDSGERGKREDSEERDKRDDNNDELATRSLRIQSKRYYVDVKQNARGRFMKLVEGLPNGNKNRISFPMSTVPEVRNKLTSFAEFYTDMGKDSNNSEKETSDDGRLKSDDIRSGQRRIYFDLKENKRGVFLRISSTASYGATRQTVALPAQGIVDIRNVLTEMIEEFGQEEEPQELPDFQEMRIERKRFYFDCGNNDRGSFLRISEVTNRYRSSITIPQQGLGKFRDILGEVMNKLDN